MNNRIFKRLGIATILAVYVLILVGGIVRASGSGMGCPDWPKCFGTWIPPTSLDQLPENYQEIFGEKLKGEVEFNVYKTWTEYVNRLLGVLIGFLIFLTFVSSVFIYWKNDRGVVWITFVAFILVGFQGWLGSIVVSTELLPWMVTTHLLVAVVIVLLLIWAIIRGQKSSYDEVDSNPSLKFTMLLFFFISLCQFLLGTRVREDIDKFNLNGYLRTTWIDQLGGSFYIHIIVAVLVLVVYWFFYFKSKENIGEVVNKYFFLLVVLVTVSFISGGVLGLFNMNAYAQPLHLTIATVVLGVQFSIYLINNKGNMLSEENG